MRKNYPDGSLPPYKPTGLHSFNNIMILGVPDEIRKPGESKYQLATLDPTKSDKAWPADDYVKKLFPKYPQKEKEKIEEKKEKSILKESPVQEVSKTENKTKNVSYQDKNKRHAKQKPHIPAQHNRFKQHHYRKKNPSKSHNQRRRASNRSQSHKLDTSISQFIDPWIRPEEILGLNNSTVLLNPPAPKFPEPVYRRPEPNEVFQRQMQPAVMSFYNQTFNSNNSIPSANVYVERKSVGPKTSVGLLGHCPSESTPQKVDDYSNYGVYDQPYDPNGHNWEDMPPAENWNDSYQEYPQNMYQGNRGRGRNPDFPRNINFAKGRGWKAMRGNNRPFRGNRRGRW